MLDVLYLLLNLIKIKKNNKISKTCLVFKSIRQTKARTVLCKNNSNYWKYRQNVFKKFNKDLLKNFGKTYSSPKSFNNHFGVPVSLSNLSFDDRYGVFEVGMSRANEIKNLTNLIKPHIGVITNIGEAHLENFQNINGIAKAKSEIIENIQEGGTIILNRDDKYFNFLFRKAKSFKLKISSFGTHKNSDIRLIKAIRKKKSTKLF